MRDHLVAGLEQRHRGVVERLLGAGGDDHFFGLDVDAVIEAIALRDGIAQLEDTGGRRVLGEVRIERVVSRLLDVLGRGEVRLAGAEIDDVHTGTAQPLRIGADLQGG